MGPTAVSWISFVIRRRVFRSFDRARNPTLSSAIESTQNGSLGRRTLTHTSVRKQEHGSREIRFQRCFPVVATEDAIFPDQQIGVMASELLPLRTLGAHHAFADQEKIRAGDGFVVELRLAARGGELL